MLTQAAITPTNDHVPRDRGRLEQRISHTISLDSKKYHLPRRVSFNYEKLKGAYLYSSQPEAALQPRAT